MGSTNYLARDADAEDPFAKDEKTYSCIQTPTNPDAAMPKQFTLWRHYKGGLYVVLGMTPWQPATANRVVYASVQSGAVWVRRRSVWYEEVEVGGMKMPRFQHFSGGGE